MTAFEHVTLVAGGLTLAPIEVRVSASASEPARSFSARLAPVEASEAATARFLAGAPAIVEVLAQGPSCVVLASGEPILTGWIERIRVKLSSTAPEISVEGRSKSGVLVDASAIHRPGEWRKTKPAAILADLAGAYGVPFVDRSSGSDQRKLFRLTQGESVVSAGWRLARVDGHLMTGAADGSLIYYRGTLGAHVGGLIEGVTLCEDAEATFDWSKRAQETRVKGQRASGWDRDDLEIDEAETDDTVSRPVRRIVVASEEIDPALARKRARWHRDQAAGEGLKVSAPRCLGWRDEAGVPWAPGWTVWVESPYLGVAEMLAIEAVEFIQTDQGTISHLALVDPRAIGGKKGKAGKSGKQWKMPK